MKNIRFFHPSENVPPPVKPVVSLVGREEHVQVLEDVFSPVPEPNVLDFYNRFDTRTLESVLLGLERDFETVSTNPAEAQFLCPADRLSRQMSTIRQILNQREEERASEPVHLRDAHTEVKRGRAKSVTRWDRKGGRA